MSLKPYGCKNRQPSNLESCHASESYSYFGLAVLRVVCLFWSTVPHVSYMRRGLTESGRGGPVCLEPEHGRKCVPLLVRVDMDIEVVRPLAPFLARGYACAVPQENPIQSGGPRITNCFLLCRARCVRACLFSFLHCCCCALDCGDRCSSLQSPWSQRAAPRFHTTTMRTHRLVSTIMLAYDCYEYI